MSQGVLSRIEVIQAARADESVRALLGLPEKIRQEDGSRDAFEAVFQMIDADDSKTVTMAEFLRAFGTAVGRVNPNLVAKAQRPALSAPAGRAPVTQSTASQIATFAMHLDMVGGEGHHHAPLPPLGSVMAPAASLPPMARYDSLKGLAIPRVARPGEPMLALPAPSAGAAAPIVPSARIPTAAPMPAPPRPLQPSLSMENARLAAVAASVRLEQTAAADAQGAALDAENARLEAENARIERMLNLESRPSFIAAGSPQYLAAAEAGAPAEGEEENGIGRFFRNVFNVGGFLAAATPNAPPPADEEPAEAQPPPGMSPVRPQLDTRSSTQMFSGLRPLTEYDETQAPPTSQPAAFDPYPDDPGLSVDAPAPAAAPAAASAALQRAREARLGALDRDNSVIGPGSIQPM